MNIWKRQRVLFWVTLICVCLSGCGTEKKNEVTATEELELDTPDVAESEQSIIEETLEESPDIQEEVGDLSGEDILEDAEIGGDFAAVSKGVQIAETKLSKMLLKQDSNVFYSPYSLFRALMLLDNAETGKAREELESVFEVADIAQVNAQFKGYDATLEESDTDTVLKSADSLWISETLQLEESAENYKKILQNSYNSALFDVDFTQDATKDAINQWVSEKTEGMIDPFLEELPKETAFALVDAVYFEGKWALPFEEELTQKSSFFGSKGETQTDTMTINSESFKVVEQDGMIGVELPYKDGRFVMDVFTSEDGNILQQFGALSEEEKESFIQRLDETEERQRLDRLTLPKFTFEYQVDGLDDCLKEIGLKSMYERGYLTTLNEALFVDSVIQKAKVEVDECGTKAAAATGVMMQEMAAMPSGVELLIDQPFLFLIRDQVNDVTLFVGSVQNL